MRTLMAVVAVILVTAAGFAAEAPLTNADVVKLVKAGVSADAIVAKIQSAQTAFTLDTDSLVALAGEKVPDSVIKAMMARAGAAATAAPASAPPAATTIPAAAPPAATGVPAPAGAEIVVKGIYRTRGICSARGDVTMTAKKLAFKALDKSPLCSEDAFGQSSAEFAWDDVTRICFEYAATGAFQVWLKNGQDMSFKATRAGIEDFAARLKSLRPDLQIRCEE